MVAVGRPAAAPSSDGSADGDAATGGPARRLVPVIGTATLAVAGLVLLVLRDPRTPGLYPTCPVLALTGLACPGCGSMRALASLGHGDVATAWAYNPLALVAVALLVGFWVAWAVRAVRGRARSRPARPWVLLTGAALVVGYAVARNLPALAPWLGPLATAQGQ
ncbi:DUF2752 domain-containing protein [Litorihabitans aurantiacus]|uniref:DUF2752 domain-containing protein n=1 Tax=Litorihabitans aurantiacus TaxID=1930061 RepID=A0AA37XD54_9MICO|nr:DUF2752 domain-containing protein [Litorihabitans aurantiacus]GMA31126.1 hypothetical protein GCM10025875_11180 [Litorihabitans aurantiacus]